LIGYHAGEQFDHFINCHLKLRNGRKAWKKEALSWLEDTEEGGDANVDEDQRPGPEGSPQRNQDQETGGVPEEKQKKGGTRKRAPEAAAAEGETPDLSEYPKQAPLRLLKPKRG
jgi:hypothetical protein